MTQAPYRRSSKLNRDDHGKIWFLNRWWDWEGSYYADVALMEYDVPILHTAEDMSPARCASNGHEKYSRLLQSRK